ncbi:hypothetical protein [Campylobacter fetus]|uniref:Uncharacterized protein n=1 Tax=Campylobacter fetus subsp. fetus (strain 82-40) TaxID=360106 RepID=A0RNP6_CAMFF|nr:hypothetical protein [Campylobacter fetus]ABK82488.1 hypothetical protein CFF8240_0654 [Campylobacter fetus subsp. fetus 82-40]
MFKLGANLGENLFKNCELIANKDSSLYTYAINFTINLNGEKNE